MLYILSNSINSSINTTIQLRFMLNIAHVSEHYRTALLRILGDLWW